MTIDKDRVERVNALELSAINILENEVRVAEVNARPAEVKAFLLGIEALKLVRRMRELRIISDLLPGETKLPTIDEFVGSDPNYTGTLTTKEYLDDIRGR